MNSRSADDCSSRRSRVEVGNFHLGLVKQGLKLEGIEDLSTTKPTRHFSSPVRAMAQMAGSALSLSLEMEDLGSQLFALGACFQLVLAIE